MELLDAPLFQTLNTLPAFPFARMVRPDRLGMRDAQSAFFSNRTLPTFTYSLADRFDAMGYLRTLNAVADRIETLPALDTIRSLYREKIEELRTRCALIQAIQQKDDVAVSSIADHLFGTSTMTAASLQGEFDHILGRVHELHTHEDRIDATLFTIMVRAMLEHYGMHEWTIRETSRLSVSVVRGDRNATPTVKIPKTFLASRARAARLLTHEIEVHALRSHNGRTSPLLLLGHGLARYITTDEGLAMSLQQSLRPETSTEPGFWDAWAAALTVNHGFMDAFDTLASARATLNAALGRKDAITQANMTAWRLMVRVSRGLHSPGPVGLGYRRDHIYRSGLIDIRQTLNTYGKTEILPTLFAGHAGTQHIPALKTLGITGRTPDMIGTQVVKDVRDAQRKTRA
mgnify:CR=1 FL=1